ncbi:hypothetical protein JTE90_001820 [Oedothorax gibbosus]|uniref:Uncharacterized protein n=1 Tax=Oedothorax gibbosus TaxID=931172 RepID=A0AAV6TE03_9ARAC|nr:hypothetical protein JTE90_001820 [Oedothorax gibbosus]
MGLAPTLGNSPGQGPAASPSSGTLTPKRTFPTPCERGFGAGLLPFHLANNFRDGAARHGGLTTRREARREGSRPELADPGDPPAEPMSTDTVPPYKAQNSTTTNPKPVPTFPLRFLVGAFPTTGGKKKHSDLQPVCERVREVGPCSVLCT